MQTSQAVSNSGVAHLDDKREPIELKWQEGERTVVVLPKDQQRYIATVGQAIKACQGYAELQEFEAQFKKTLACLGQWARERADEIRIAYLTVRDRDLLYVVVLKKTAYNRDFEDALTELDLDVANNGELSLLRLNVLALPNASSESIATFLSPPYTICVFPTQHAE